MSTRKYEDIMAERQEKLKEIRSKREKQRREKLERNFVLQPENTNASTFVVTAQSPQELVEDEVKTQDRTPDCVAVPVLSKATTTAEKYSNAISKLSVSRTQVTDIQPKKTEVVTKSTQTHMSRIPLKLVIPALDFKGDELLFEGPLSSKLPPGCMSPGLPKLHFVEPAKTKFELIKEEAQPVQLLTEEESQAIVSSHSFQHTLRGLARTVEKVIEHNVDITRDYYRATDTENEIESRARAQLSLNHIFSDGRWTKNRSITDIDISWHYPELIAASYHMNERNPLEPDGLVVLWNTADKNKTPENIFHSKSPVLSTCIAKCSNNFVLGGTYSGQIVVWDKRSPKPIPVQCTNNNCKAHVQPIFSLQMLGSDESHSIISISSDGKLCTWSLDMITEPTQIFTLENGKYKTVAATCLAAASENSDYLIGSEDGCIYTASQNPTKPGVSGKYEGHDAPITAISLHDIVSSDCGKIFLTSSMDSTINLWSEKKRTPLRTLSDNYDYVMDIAWSPVHPALFAVVDGSGRFDLWNVNKSFEEPIISINVTRHPSLNRLSWLRNGQQIVLGDLDGNLYLYDVNEKLSHGLPDETSVLCDTLKSLM